MDKWGLEYEFGEDPILKIEAVKDRWLKANKDLEDIKYIENLIHLDFIEAIKNYRTMWDYRLTAIKTVVDELKITDGRKKKTSLNCLNDWIKADFFPEIDVKIKVHNIMSCGCEGYGWQIGFDINGETYFINIPDKKVLNFKNLPYAYEGKFAFMHKTGKSSISVEHTDYTEEGMAKFIKAYFDELFKGV